MRSVAAVEASKPICRCSIVEQTDLPTFAMPSLEPGTVQERQIRGGVLHSKSFVRERNGASALVAQDEIWPIAANMEIARAHFSSSESDTSL